jgi:hypothetical protein
MTVMDSMDVRPPNTYRDWKIITKSSRKRCLTSCLFGPYAGEIAEVDHILPVAKFPNYGKEFWNLELMPQSLNRRKGDTVGQRQMDLLNRLRVSSG